MITQISDGNPLVTIIVPVYNTCEYLPAMVNCLLNQSYKHFEAIFIDDGSSDNSLDILNEYASSDRRLTIIHQKNRGVSLARNVGIKYARGEYVFFLDSDDLFEETLVSDCLDLVKRTKADTILYGYAGYVNDNIQDVHEFHLEKDLYSGHKEIVEGLMPHFMGYSLNSIYKWTHGRTLSYGVEHTALWRSMLSKKIIDDNKLKFDKNLSLGEDTIFINQYLMYANKVSILKKTLYYLRARQGSLNYTNQNDFHIQLLNKEKVITEKDKISRELLGEGYDIYPYWDGNNVLSSVQLCLGLSKSEGGFIKNYDLYRSFQKNVIVEKSLKQFTMSACGGGVKENCTLF